MILPAMRRLLIAAAAATILCACRAPGEPIRMVTTTSVENSGLLESLLPAFEREHGAEIQALAVGSGQAFQIARRGDASILLTHEPLGERALFDDGLVRFYSKFMFNRFVIAGPAADPARITEASSAAGAMARIAQSGAVFVSRGDESGTHVREKTLWQTAATRPAPSTLIETGQGMSATLRVASERGGYVLTDEATLARLEGALNLKTLFTHDAALLNTYAVAILSTARPDPSGAVAELARWLVEPPGQNRIDAFRINNRQVFFSWPAGVDRTAPETVPPPR